MKRVMIFGILQHHLLVEMIGTELWKLDWVYLFSGFSVPIPVENAFDVSNIEACRGVSSTDSPSIELEHSQFMESILQGVDGEILALPLYLYLRRLLHIQPLPLHYQLLLLDSVSFG